MCFEAKYEPASIDWCQHHFTPQRPNSCSPADKDTHWFYLTVNTFEERKEPGGLSFLSQLVVTSDQLCDWHIHYTAYVATANL